MTRACTHKHTYQPAHQVHARSLLSEQSEQSVKTGGRACITSVWYRRIGAFKACAARVLKAYPPVCSGGILPPRQVCLTAFLLLYPCGHVWTPPQETPSLPAFAHPWRNRNLAFAVHRRGCRPCRCCGRTATSMRWPSAT